MNARIFAGTALAAAVLCGSAQASVLISSAPTSNMNCLGGFCQATAKQAVLNATDLANMLVDQDVTIRTGSGAVTITVEQSFSWTSVHKLSLQADLNVSFQAPITVAGTGALDIQYGKSGSGDLVIFPGAGVSFWDVSSAFTLQGQSYTLAASLDDLTAAMNAAGNTGNFALAGDFDQTGRTYKAAPLDGSRTVALEGLGHTISNLVVHNTKLNQCVGLFGTVFGSVSDLNVTGADMQAGKKSSAGVINGCGNVTLANLSTAGNVGVGEASFGGGLSGGNESSITGSSSSANVTASSSGGHAYIGGLVGVYDGGSNAIANSSASGAITGGQNAIAGGLVGVNSGVVRFSQASGDVTVGTATHPKEGAGGLVGLNNGAVTQSFASGHVSGGNGYYVGGLVGANTSFSGAGVEDSYATGAVQCALGCFAGGLAGGGSGFSQSYATGAVSGGSGAEIGGFIGYLEGAKEFSQVYWDLDTSGVSDPAQGAGNIAGASGVTGLSDAALKAALPTGFDPAIWKIKRKINHGYPYLVNAPPQ